MKSISTDIIKARVAELQTDVDRVKGDLISLKEKVTGNFTADDVQRIEELTRELITYKAGQAELVSLLQDSI
tara:strand:+ start:99 stop:314 length:216 start_codon:yes stop_codon:yes gene_type:complete